MYWILGLLFSLALSPEDLHAQPCDLIYGNPKSESSLSYLGIAEAAEKFSALKAMDDKLRIPILSGLGSKSTIAIVDFNSRLQALRSFDPQKAPFFSDRIHEAATLHLTDQYEQMLSAKRNIEALMGPKPNAALIENFVEAGRHSNFESLISTLNARTPQTPEKDLVQALWDSSQGTFIASLLSRNKVTPDALNLLVGDRGIRFRTRENQIQTWYSPFMSDQPDSDPIQRIRIILRGRAPGSPKGWQTAYTQGDLAARILPLSN